MITIKYESEVFFGKEMMLRINKVAEVAEKMGLRIHIEGLRYNQKLK